jgi:hypothetical protein
MLNSDTIAKQSALAQYCLSGTLIPIEGASPERLSQYRRLVFGVFSGILEQAYPITYNFLGEIKWNQLITSFVSKYPCSDPQVWKMPKELVTYVQENNMADIIDCIFLVDLLRFEWLEIEVYCMEDISLPNFSAVTDIMDSALCFNPHYQILQLNYPVHKMNKVNPEEHFGNYTILSFRDEKGKANFLSLDPHYAVALDSMIQNAGISASEILNELTTLSIEFKHPNFKNSLEELLNRLRKKGFILGQLDE